MLNTLFKKTSDKQNLLEAKVSYHNSKIECTNGETYEWSSDVNKWINANKDHENPTFAENLELNRLQVKLYNGITFLTKPYKTETNKRTNVEIGYYSFGQNTPSLKVTFSDGREYVRLENSKWYDFPNFNKCNERTSYSLQKIVEQTELSNRKKRPQNIKPRRSGLWIQR